VPDSVLEGAPRPSLLGRDDLRGRAEAEEQRARLLRELAWESAFTAEQVRAASLIGIIADANRCGVEARRAR
jgi:hypothetical protein